MRFILKILFFIYCFQYVQATGGIDIAGGGGGVVQGNDVYLTDLFELGLHDKSYFSEARPSKNIITGLAYSNIYQIASPTVVSKIANKIEEVSQYSPLLAASILEAIKITKWTFTSADLQVTEDTRPCILKFKPSQIALRRGSVVVIHHPLFVKMNSDHQAALILHEVISALSSNSNTTSCLIRRTLAFLITNEYRRYPMDQLNAVFSILPTEFHRTSQFDLLKNKKTYAVRSPQFIKIISTADHSNLAINDFKKPASSLMINSFLFSPEMRIWYLNGPIEKMSSYPFDLKTIQYLCKNNKFKQVVSKIEVVASRSNVYIDDTVNSTQKPFLNQTLEKISFVRYKNPKPMNLSTQLHCSNEFINDMNALAVWEQYFLTNYNFSN